MMMKNYKAESYEFPESIKGMRFVGDIESNGLYQDLISWKKGDEFKTIAPKADLIWMACHVSPETGVCYDFINDEIYAKHKREIRRYNRTSGRKVTVLPLKYLPAFWEHCGDQYYHNGMKFDFPVVEKLLGFSLDREKRKDTLIMSQALDCDRSKVKGSKTGPHSIESWAIRLGLEEGKVEHNDWLQYTLNMYIRCVGDIRIGVKVLHYLESEIKVDKIECNVDWTKAMRTEHMAAYWIAYSEMWGFPCDIPFANKLVATLDEALETTEDELLPNMPFRQWASADARIGSKKNWEEYSENFLKNSGLTQLPDNWGWPQDFEEGEEDPELPNRQLPMWKPFTVDGELSAAVVTYFHGKEAQDMIPATDAIEHVKTVKAKKAKFDKEGNEISPAVEAVKGVRAKKAQPAIEAKDEVESCYMDDSGLTTELLHRCVATDVSGPFTRIKWADYNLGSDAQVKEYLMRYTNWKWTELTDTGRPKLTEASFDSIGGDLGRTLKNYLIDKSRRTNIKNFKNPSKGWLNNIRDDGRITPTNHTMGTPTARSRHAGLVNVPSGGARRGNEMRQCWTAYEGGLQLGSDAAGLEMRMLAHYMNDAQCTHDIVDGDIHKVIWKLIDDLVGSRGKTKVVEYALIYGSGDENLGSNADVEGCRELFTSKDKLLQRGWIKDGELWRHSAWFSKKESLSFTSAQDTVLGAIMRQRIMKGLKPLGDAIEKVTKLAERGFLIGIDGRKLKCRSTHSALNLQLQSTGAILMKTALVTLMEKYEELGYVKTGADYIPNKYVELFTFYHDEYQLGIPKSAVTDTKVINLDLSEFDLEDKQGKKDAKEAAGKTVERFHNRELRRKKIVWSSPTIDLEKGVATLQYSHVGQLCVEAFEQTGREFKINLPITGDYMIGANWKDCH